MYDPKLKEALAKMEAICREYDIGGFISLISKEGGEFRYILPKWIGLKEEPHPEGARLRMQLKKHDPKNVENTELADLTGHFLFGLGDTLSHTLGWISTFCEELRARCKVEHTPFANFRPHKGEEN